MKTLKQRLKSGLDNFYLLQGEDSYLYDRALSMIKKACNISFPDFNYQVFDDENFSANALRASLESMPFSDEKRLTVVKNVEKLSENDKKIIISYCENPLSSSVLVVCDYANKFDFLKPYSQFVDCKRFDYPLAKAIIVNDFAKYNKKISEEAITALYDSCNGYLSKISLEIQKISAYLGDEEFVTKQVVDNLTSKDSEYMVFELTESLGAKKTSRAIELLNLMLKQQGLLALITNHFRRLFFISISDQDNKTLANLLGVKEYAVTKMRTQVKNFSKVQLKKIYSLLEEVDYMIKSGAMLQDTALNYLVFSILNI